MSLDIDQLLMESQALSPEMFSSVGRDLPMFRALAKAVNPLISYVYTQTITSANVAVPTKIFTVPAGGNTVVRGYSLFILVEKTTASGGLVGVYNFTVRWTANGAPSADATSVSLTGGPTANMNSGYYFFFADVGTDITWEFDNSYAVGGSVAVRSTLLLSPIV